MADTVYREEPQSGIIFGPFDSSYYYDIEKSKDIKLSRSTTLKSVECVAIRENKLLFIEAKKTAPKDLSAQNAKDRLSEMIKPGKREDYDKLMRSLSITPAYIADVCEKFLMSLCLVMSIAEGRISSKDMLPPMMEAIRDPSIIPVFVLVITWSKKDWARNVQDAFNIALRKFERTNRAKVQVLTAEQAKNKGLVSEYVPMMFDSLT